MLVQHVQTLRSILISQRLAGSFERLASTIRGGAEHLIEGCVCLFVLIPLCNLYTGTRPVVIEFLAFSIRNIGPVCSALKQITCARLIGFVSLFRLETPLRG